MAKKSFKKIIIEHPFHDDYVDRLKHENTQKELTRVADALEAQNTKLDILVETFGVIITQLLFKKISFVSAEENEEQETSSPVVP